MAATDSTSISQSVDKRTRASALNEEREDIIAHVISGRAISVGRIRAAFKTPIGVLMCLHGALREHVGPIAAVERVGGLGAHYDFLVTNIIGTQLRVELKCCDEDMDFDALRPWAGAVQFRQGQIGSEDGRRLLGDCGEPMVRAWFEGVVRPFCEKWMPELTDMTLAEYWDGMKRMGDAVAAGAVAGKRGFVFQQRLRERPDAAAAIGEAWATFQDEYLSAHQPDCEVLRADVAAMFAEKDVWICVSNTHAKVFSGVAVDGLVFEGSVMGRKCRVLRYTMRMRSLGTGDVRDVPLELRFNWKNGGQGVGNLNFMFK
jgi:hypothetical protein